MLMFMLMLMLMSKCEPALRCSENLTSSITCIYYVYIIIFINFIKGLAIVVTRPFGSLVQVLGSYFP